jgi:AcrR family transcriptional regulator
MVDLMAKRSTAHRPPRRSGEDARRAILDTAERLLVASGPAGLRLQEVAAEAGISHPAILHHFGSRDGLLRAVVEHATARLQEELFTALRALPERMPPGGSPGAALFDLVHETLESRGQGRLIAWLLLAGYDPFDAERVRRGFARIVDLTHALRQGGGKRTPKREDTVFAVVLSALALLGEALAGQATFAMAGLGREPANGAHFRAWLAALLEERLEPGGKKR